MTSEEIYKSNKDLLIYNTIMENKEILTKEEYDFCFSWDSQETQINIFKLSEGRYLNLLLYSEMNKEESDLRREIGL